MKIRYKFTIFAAMMAVAVPASAAVNLIKNGSFELGTDPGSILKVTGANTTTVTDWGVNAGQQFFYAGDVYDAAAGVRSIDLSGVGAAPGVTGVGGSIWQQVGGLTVGKAYSVSFELSNKPGSPAGGIVRLSTPNAASQNFTFANNPVTSGDMEWQRVAYRFIATAKSQRVTFSNLNTTANRPFGPVIDNVIMTEVIPEPQTWALFVLGFGLVGSGMRVRNRHAVSA
jgi:hypothetical protein